MLSTIKAICVLPRGPQLAAQCHTKRVTAGAREEEHRPHVEHILTGAWLEQCDQDGARSVIGDKVREALRTQVLRALKALLRTWGLA